jgi:hypothetical protein
VLFSNAGPPLGSSSSSGGKAPIYLQRDVPFVKHLLHPCWLLLGHGRGVVLRNAPDSVVLAVQKGEASLQAGQQQYISSTTAVQLIGKSGRGVVLRNAPDTVVRAVQKGEASLQAVQRQYTGIQAVQCRASGRGVVLCNAPDTAVTAVQEGEVSLRVQEVKYQYQSTPKVAVPEAQHMLSDSQAGTMPDATSSVYRRLRPGNDSEALNEWVHCFVLLEAAQGILLIEITLITRCSNSRVVMLTCTSFVSPSAGFSVKL